MTKERWESLKDGDLVFNSIDGFMVVVYSSAFGYEKELCLADNNSLWRGVQFSPVDWELVKEEENV